MSLENSSSSLRFFSVGEMSGREKVSYRFKSFLLNAGERQLLRDGDPIPLTPKVFDTLVYLVENAGHLVEKGELMESVWPDAVVEEGNLSRSIHALRRALGQDDNGNKFIETVPTKGYRFVADVTAVQPPERGHENGNVPPPQAGPEPPQITEAKPGRPLGDRISTRVVFLALTALVAVSLILFAFKWYPETPAAKSGQVSLAVLPLRPVDAGNRDAVYEIGIADSLIVQLGRSQMMTVRQLSAVRKYLDVEQDVLAAGREQKVDYVLASTYTLANGRVRVSSQLMNVRTGSIEDNFVFDTENADVLAASDTIASNIGRRLLAKLNIGSDGSKAKKGTANGEAYRLYLQGINLVNRRGGENHAKAAEHLERAVALDPNYAVAWFGLGYARLGMSMGGGEKLGERQRAREAAQKALALDPDFAEAYALLAEVLCLDDWNHIEAEKLHRRSLELDPKSSFVHRSYALHLGHLGQFDESIAQIKTAIDLDPNSAYDQQNLGMLLYYARRYDEAIVHLEQVREMFPDHQQTHAWLANSYRAKGEYQKALENLLRTPEGKKTDLATETEWRNAIDEAGWLGLQRLRIKTALQSKEWSPIGIAGMAAALGDNDLAFAQLEEACKRRIWSAVWINVNPAFDPIRSDPRFQEILRRVNLN